MARVPYQRLSEAELAAHIAHLQWLVDALDPIGSATAARLHADCWEALAEALREEDRRAAI